MRQLLEIASYEQERGRGRGRLKISHVFGLEVCSPTKTILIDSLRNCLRPCSDMDIVETCQQNFSFCLPSDILHKHTKKFLNKIIIEN